MVFNQNTELRCRKAFWTSGFAWMEKPEWQTACLIFPPLPVVLPPLEEVWKQGWLHGPVTCVVTEALCSEGPWLVSQSAVTVLNHNTFWKRDLTFSLWTGSCKLCSQSCLRVCRIWPLLELVLRPLGYCGGGRELGGGEGGGRRAEICSEVPTWWFMPPKLPSSCTSKAQVIGIPNKRRCQGKGHLGGAEKVFFFFFWNSIQKKKTIASIYLLLTMAPELI